jgi:thioredoxin-like negative regulator of GroEL
MLDPTVVKLAEEFKDRVKFVRVNVDDSPKVAADYRVNSIPTLGLLHRGELLEKQVGVQSENSLRRWLIDLLKSLESQVAQREAMR